MTSSVTSSERIEQGDVAYQSTQSATLSLALDSVSVECAVADDAVRVTATASLTGKTGVEM